ncbi:MAG: hypothetical protein H0W63_00445 [Gemmatimonadaceae bacterium]|nr:hypothetical protein [Gemmatimonadaceae bacterium]
MEGVDGDGAPEPKKPALLKGGMILCWIYAVVLLLVLAMLPKLDEMTRVGSSAAAGLPGGAELQAKFASEMKSTSQIFIIPLLVLSIIAAYGLAKNRYWSRAVMMVLLILGVVLVPPEMASPTMYALSAAVAIFGWWYLYRKANVVEYYRAIRPETK